MSKHRLVHIRWHDAKGVHGTWQHLEDLEDEPLKDYIVDSVGFVLRESETVIHIAPHLHVDGDEGHYVGDMRIPKNMIVDMWEIP